jgi:hypothetical protein
MTSLVSASQVVTGQVQSLDSVRSHALPSDAMIFASGTKVQPANQNPGSYAIVESGVNSLGVTTTGSVPAVTQSPFADLYKEGSIYFNGTAGNYLQNTASYSNGSIQWNTTGMTVEAWVNYPTFTGAAVNQGTGLWQPTLIGMMAPGTNSNYWGFGSNTTGYVTFWYTAPGTNQSVTAQTPISTNTWNHIAMTCSTTGQIFLFVNGVQSPVVANRNGSVQGATYFEATQGTPSVASYFLTTGQYNSTALNAYVADLRLTTGAPVYTGSTGTSYATFTVPSAPLSSTTSPGVTQFLLRAGQNSPTIQSGALTFDRGLKQYMNFGPQTFNIATRGFTAVFKYTWNGTVSNFERIFQATTTTANQNNSIVLCRSGSAPNQIQFQYDIGGTIYTVYSGSGINQGTTYTVAFVYNPSVGGGAAQFWVNGTPSGSGTTGLASSITTDLLTPFTFVGCDYTGAGSFTSTSMNTLAVYNRALSNAEILNAYSALTTATTNAPIEIGDVNGTPAMSIASDGRVNVTKLGQTSNVLPWPPAAMTGYVTSINGGNYVASASSEYSSSNPAWYAFARGSSPWGTTALYSSSLPYSYTGTATTTDTQGTVYLGEWIQVQLASQILLSSYYIQINSTTQAPKKFVILGSRDGVNWFLVDSQSSASAASQTYTLSSIPSQAFTWYRMVCNQTAGNNGSLFIQQLILYGTADTAQTLTVSQPMTLSYGAQTASLTGISGDKFVPQDFSSSGLNVPAYVVSNTATVANTVAFSSFGPFAGEGSLYFPGAAASSGAYINFPAGTPAASMTPATAFTAETFLYLAGTPTPTYCGVFDSINTIGGSENWGINLNGTNATFFIWPTSGGVSQITGSATLINTWFHIAASYDGTTLRLFINGALANSTGMVGTPRLISGSIFVIGTNGVFRTGCPMYMADARIVTGTALYTSAFTPPTGPLQPIQGTTQAGTPYGTVLLLRNAPAPGRVLTSKFGGANSSSVLSFPPAAMTGYSTALNSGYGQGTYVASASSELSGNLAWWAFDKGTGGNWFGTGVGYSSGAATTSSPATVDVTGTTYYGDWLQIQLACSVVLSSYVLNTTGLNLYTPKSWWIFGSRDGVTWYVVHQVSGQVQNINLTFAMTSAQAFNYYRIVIASTNGASPAILEWTLNGTIEGPNVTADGRLGVGVSAPVQALEVAGSAVVAGTLSAGNPLMFRNRIINGHMRVFQRGTTFSLSGAAAATYTLDRWSQFTTSGTTRTVSNVLDVPFRSGFISSANVVATAATTTTEFWLKQLIEMYNVADLAGSPVTLSFWYKSNRVGNHGVRFSNQNLPGASPTDTYQTFTVTNANTWEYKVLTFNSLVQATAPTSTTAWNDWGISINIGPVVFNMGSTSIANGDYFTLTGVQLEKGSVATPYEIRPYATELALCQRYYQEMPNTNGGHFTGAGRCQGSLAATNGSVCCTGMYFQVPMRANPTPVYYGAGSTPGVFAFYTGSSGAQVSVNQSTSNVITAQISSTMMAINISTASVLASGGSSGWYDMGWGSTGLGITLAAEL